MNGMGAGDTVNVAGKLTNSIGGTFALSGAHDVANLGYITNAGTISISSGAALNVTGGTHAAVNALPGFLNSGIVNISQGATLSSPLSYVQTSGQTTVDGTLNIAGRGMINFAGGSVYGNQGTIQGSITSNGAINIGDGPMTVGQLSFVGNYMQGANGSLTFDIAGAAAGQYDQLNVSGHAKLNGLMTVDLINGFVPQVGNMSDMNFSSSSGTFSKVLGLPIDNQEHFVLEYNSTNLTLDVVPGQLSGLNAASGFWFASNPADNNGVSVIASAIASQNDVPSSTPEPGSFLLLGSGLLCPGYAIRRRMTK